MVAEPPFPPDTLLQWVSLILSRDMRVKGFNHTFTVTVEYAVPVLIVELPTGRTFAVVYRNYSEEGTVPP